MLFLSEDCFGVMKVFLSDFDFISLCLVNKEVYEECRSLKFFKLTEYYSELYYSSDEFRCQVKQTISSPRQISVNLSAWNYDEMNHRNWYNITTEDVSDTSVIADVHTLDVSRCHEVIDVSALGGLHISYI